MNFYQRDFLTLLDYNKDEIDALIDLGIRFKKLKNSNVSHKLLKGKNVVLIKELDTTKNSCAFDVATRDLGMNVTNINFNDVELRKRETFKDNVRFLSSMYDGIAYYGFLQERLDELVKYSGVPVWNILTNNFDPVQVLSDLMTIKEYYGNFKNKKIAYCGNGKNSVCSSLMIICSKLGIDFICCSPKELWPNDEIFNRCKAFSEENKSKIVFEEDVMRGTFMADVIYTDAWVSKLEDNDLWENRIKLLSNYQVNKKVMDNAKNKAIFLHPLPAFHNKDTELGKEFYEKYGISEMEVTDEVFESNQSKVFEQSENYLHCLKAVMCASLYKGVIK